MTESLRPTPFSPGQKNETTIADRAIERLRAVYDPEIPVNIYDLGLIYRIAFVPAPDGRQDVRVEMTLTTANCPLAEMIPGMVHDALADLPDLREIEIALVWDPPWTPDRMSEEARLELDMF